MADLCATSPDDTIRDGAAALAYGIEVCNATTRPRWDALLALASAHAEVGDFASAVSAADRALNCSLPHARSECLARLAEFRNNRPWRAQR
jgi:hypothetical protein